MPKVFFSIIVLVSQLRQKKCLKRSEWTPYNLFISWKGIVWLDCFLLCLVDSLIIASICLVGELIYQTDE
jgi:hypothetical protein